MKHQIWQHQKCIARCNRTMDWTQRVKECCFKHFKFWTFPWKLRSKRFNISIIFFTDIRKLCKPWVGPVFKRFFQRRPILIGQFGWIPGLVSSLVCSPCQPQRFFCRMPLWPKSANKKRAALHLLVGWLHQSCTTHYYVDTVALKVY